MIEELEEENDKKDFLLAIYLYIYKNEIPDFKGMKKIAWLGLVSSLETSKNRALAKKNKTKTNKKQNKNKKKTSQKQTPSTSTSISYSNSLVGDKEEDCQEEGKEEVTILTPTEINFNKFWKEYPKKVSKQKAFESFKKIKMDNHLFKLILKQLELFKQTKDWNKDNGQFIPYASTWLNQKRWEDEISEKDLKTITTKDLADKYDWSDY